MAPKQELMINLACLAHPPRTATVSARSEFLPEDYGVRHMVRDIWQGAPSQERLKYSSIDDQDMRSLRGNSDFFIDADMTIAIPLSPADKWMLDVQRRMAADRKRWNMGKGNQTRDGLPHGPVGGIPAGGGIENGPGGVDPDGKNGSVGVPGRAGEPSPHSRPDIGREGSRDEDPRPGEIDPRLCKKDPRVQAAAAKLMMSKWNLRVIFAPLMHLLSISHDFMYGHPECAQYWILGRSLRSNGSNLSSGRQSCRICCKVSGRDQDDGPALICYPQ